MTSTAQAAPVEPAVEVAVMHPGRAHRTPGLFAVALLLAALAATVSGAPPASAATLSVRLEAGRQTGVSFDRSWHVTSRRTVTLDAPVTETATSRRTEPPGGTWLRLSSGPLAGRWVREGATAHVAGFAGSTSFSPARRVTLGAGTWELYRFDGDGRLLEARGRRIAAPEALDVDRVAVVRGLRHVRIAFGPLAGWWIPGSAANPVPVACTAGGPPAPATPIVVRAVAGATGELALTFDMGGRLTPALAIVRYLELTRTCATLFPTGTAALTPTGMAVMAEVAAHPELFELGNHTMHHCNLRDGGGGAACPVTRPGDAFAVAELRDAAATIAALAGARTTPWWRPPYGAVDGSLRTAAAGAGYPATVLWSIDTIDWRPVAKGGPTAARTAARVVDGRSPGAVVLLHLGGYTTRNALPAMIAGLRASGYVPTTLSALFRAGA